MQLNPYEQKEQEIRESVSEARQKEFHAALEAILKTEEGRLVFSEIFRHFFLYQSPHDGHGATTSFQCGQQSVSFRLRDWIKGADIYMNYWPLIEKENMERENKWRASKRKNSKVPAI